MDDLAKEFERLFGGNDGESTVRQFLDTGYAPLNYALSARWRDGGFPVGRITEVAGPPAAGKTAIATAAMAAAQKMGGIAAFADHERSFSLMLAPRLGLDTRPGRFIYKKPRTFEESLALCVKVAKYVRDNKKIPDDAPICWVFDSLASMVASSVIFDKDGKERGLDSRNMNDNTALARATSAAMPAFAQYVEEFNIAAIFLNQIRTKIGVMYGDPRTTPGGEAPKFYASVRVMLGAASKIKKGETIIGSEISAGVIKNKVSRPYLTAKWRFVFDEAGYGKFDAVRSTLDFLIEQKMIETSGSYVVWVDGKKYNRDPLVKKIEEEGLQEQLWSLLPANYEPELVKPEELEIGSFDELSETT